MDPEEASRLRRERNRGGKMEKSFINFAAQHPRWEPEEDGKQFLTNLMQYSLTLPPSSLAVQMLGSKSVHSLPAAAQSFHASQSHSHSQPGPAATAAGMASQASAGSIYSTPTMGLSMVEGAPQAVPPHAALYPLLDSVRGGYVVVVVVVAVVVVGRLTVCACGLRGAVLYGERAIDPPAVRVARHGSVPATAGPVCGCASRARHYQRPSLQPAPASCTYTHPTRLHRDNRRVFGSGGRGPQGSHFMFVCSMCSPSM